MLNQMSFSVAMYTIRSKISQRNVPGFIHNVLPKGRLILQKVLSKLLVELGSLSPKEKAGCISKQRKYLILLNFPHLRSINKL